MFRKKLRRNAKLQMIWKMQESALDLVIAALQKIRETSDRLPRASRLSVQRLQFVAPKKVDLLEPVRERVRICTKCPHLASSRTQTVFGVGNPDAELMFIGEAPAWTRINKANPLSVGPVSCSRELLKRWDSLGGSLHCQYFEMPARYPAWVVRQPGADATRNANVPALSGRTN